MKQEYIEQIYAGWLAKIIGIRTGAPIEGWTYDKIKNIFGELEGYPVDYRDFAADDDSNGPLFFLRALQDKRGEELTAQDVGNALLNYAPFEHGFFWWGGYGISTEHTAYLNLRNGIPAPQSGSIEQNGHATAEQIGGQIFIDTWGLVNPGNPDRAARFAEKAASVTHGGNGIYGGIFVAAAISYAFVEKDITKIIEKGLTYIPADCEYTRVVRAVMDFHAAHPENWRDCFRYIYENFGYDRYPGNCHIIPNIACMILALLYGGGDFTRTINICNMCGWDTDCNVGNVATIMGVVVGLDGIEYDRWRKPINDFLACSSVMGSMNIMDIPYGAAYIAKLAYLLDGEEAPEPWKTILEERIDSCHFELPGSTHAIRVRVDRLDANGRPDLVTHVQNTDEAACTGSRSLRVLASPVANGENVYVYKKTHYVPADFHDSRYDPCFSPLIYPGQTLHASASLPSYAEIGAFATLYVHDEHSGKVYESEPAALSAGTWSTLSWQIPQLDGALLDEAGVCFHLTGDNARRGGDFTALIDNLYFDGAADYSVELAKEREELWTGLHREISQFTKLKGLMYLADGQLHLSCSDFAEAYTGSHTWKDYTAQFVFTPLTGQTHRVNVRVQGAIRSYAFALLPDGQAAIQKNDNGYIVLAQTPFAWETGKEYTVTVTVKENEIRAQLDGIRLCATDTDYPYLTGAVGISMENGSHESLRSIRVTPA